jgi:type III restriction enzyme
MASRLSGSLWPGGGPSRFVVPVPATRKRTASAQASFALETYEENALINDIRRQVDEWRRQPDPEK